MTTTPQTRRDFCRFAAGTAATALSAAAAPPKLPNIVYILADDLGFGDVHYQNPDRGKLATPNIDRLAAEGMRFTDAHSNSAVCTPTRYGIMTGRYAWRSRLQSGVLGPYGKTLIPPSRMTAASLLRSRGYATACVGKWHLGWNWPQQENGQYRFDQPITGGPTELGFDSYFGTDVPNYPPYCFIRNDRTVGIPSEPKPKEMYGTDGIMLPGWKLEAILPELVRESSEYIQRASRAGKPFFLYAPLTSPHTPLAVSEEWRGKSGFGLYGDWVMQTDWAVGEILRSIDQSGQRDNTLVLFTSDNGCAPYIGLQTDMLRNRMGSVSELVEKGHYPSGPYRGYKSDIWEGGHRVAFLARWPGVVKAGSRSDEVICHTDFLATCAEITGTSLPANAGEDSVSILPALRGVARKKPLREATVHHSIQGKFAIRQGRWKLALCPGSGGWTEPTDKNAAAQKLPEVQLYDMVQDPAEQHNLQSSRPKEVEHLTGLLRRYVSEGRSTPGPKQSNDVDVDLYKKAPAPTKASD